jgi:peroxiredoxin
MEESFHEINEIADRKKADMRTACYRLAVNRIAEAFNVRGIFPQSLARFLTGGAMSRKRSLWAALIAWVLLVLPAPGPAADKKNRDTPPSPFRVLKRRLKFSLVHFPKARPSPDFSLPDLEGKIVRLFDLRGKVLVLNFWATWCPPCVEEMPSLEKLHRQFQGRPFEVVAVSVDAEGVEKVRVFVKKGKFTFRVLHDRKKTTEYPFGVRGLPISYVLDSKGRMVAGAIGAKDWASKKAYAYLEGLLKNVSNL